MDQITFEKQIAALAREYFSMPRSTRIPTPEGPIDLSQQSEDGGHHWIWILEDFADHLKES